jgi:hypothetical protein
MKNELMAAPSASVKLRCERQSDERYSWAGALASLIFNSDVNQPFRELGG